MKYPTLKHTTLDRCRQSSRVLAIVVAVIAPFVFFVKANGQETIRWDEKAKNSDVIYINGVENKTIDTGGLKISATLIERKHWIPHVFVAIINTRDTRILVDPTNWTLDIQGDKVKVLKSKEPDSLANSLDRRGAISSALSSFGGSMATKETTGTIRNPNGTTSTVTIVEKDEAAQARANATGRQNRDTLASAAAYVRSSSLRMNTVEPGDQVYGVVWFEDKGYKSVILKIRIGTDTYEFPFQKRK